MGSLVGSATPYSKLSVCRQTFDRKECAEPVLLNKDLLSFPKTKFVASLNVSVLKYKIN